jgi:hypothetical protein
MRVAGQCRRMQRIKWLRTSMHEGGGATAPRSRNGTRDAPLVSVVSEVSENPIYGNFSFLRVRPLRVFPATMLRTSWMNMENH